MQQLAPSPSLRGIPEHGPVSLWEMLRVLAQQYVDLGYRMGDLSTVLRMASSHDRDEPESRLTTDELGALRRLLNETAAICEQIPLPHSCDLLRYAIDNLPTSEGELEILLHGIKREMERRTFLVMPQSKVDYYESNNLLPDVARVAFPKATSELRSAGNCYVFNLPTACVFHCMLALEHALRALAEDVGLSWTKEQWHTMIELIEAAIKKEQGSLPKGVPKDERLNFLSVAAKEFYYFKDSWRNYVAHNKIPYEEPQALQTLTHVRDFIDHLSKQLEEK